MLVLKRLIAFMVTSVTLFAGGGVAFAGLGQPSALGIGAATVRLAGHGRYRLVP